MKIKENKRHEGRMSNFQICKDYGAGLCEKPEKGVRHCGKCPQFES